MQRLFISLDNDYHFHIVRFNRERTVMLMIQKFFKYNQRTLKKTLSYYVMHIVVAMLVAYAVTRNIWMAMTLSFLEPTVQAFAFFFHEKVWNKRDKNQTIDLAHE